MHLHNYLQSHFSKSKHSIEEVWLLIELVCLFKYAILSGLNGMKKFDLKKPSTDKTQSQANKSPQTLILNTF